MCGIRQLAQCRGADEPVAIQARPSDGSDRGTQGFREFDDRLTASGTCHTHDDLPRGDDLSGLGHCFDDDAIRIGDQHRVARFVTGDVGLGGGRIELRSCRLGGSLHFVVRRGGDCAGRDEVAVSRLIVRGLPRARRRSGNGLFVRARGEPEVRRIDAYERLASRDGLPGIDQTLENLPWNAEPQVALHSRRDDAGERTVPLRGGLHRGDPHEGVLCSRVNGGSGVVACRHRKGDQTDEDEEWGRTALKHGDLRKNERLHTTTSDYLCQ